MKQQRVLILMVAAIVLVAGPVWAQKKLDLDDLAIKGQLHNDDRLRMLARQKYQLKNYIKYRQNFRDEIVESIPSSPTRYPVAKIEK
jgi:parvulin-like peptidyl-prolyl isomerase